MSREDDLRRDMEWWDSHRAGAYGGYKGGYSSTDDPYLHMSPEEKQRELSQARSRDEEDRQRQRNIEASYAAEEARREAAYARRVETRGQYYKAAAEARERERQAAEEEKMREQKKEAFERAKRRFNNLNIFKKIILKGLQKDPKYVNPKPMSLDEINSLYGGRSR